MNLSRHFVIPRIYPVWCLTIALIAGIWWQWCGYSWPMAVAVCAGSTIIAVALCAITGLPRSPYLIVYCASFLGGAYRFHERLTRYRKLHEDLGRHVCYAVGSVAEINETADARLRYVIKLDASLLYTQQGPTKPYGQRAPLILHVSTARGIRVADRILVSGIRVKKPTNDDYGQYLLKEGFAASAVVSRSALEVIERPSFSIRRIIKEYRQWLLHSFRRTMSTQTYCAFASIFLGNPTAKKREERLKNQLRMWGLFHYIARAGLHLVIFVSVWVFVLGILPLPWLWRQLVIIALCCLYYLFTWPSIPFNRAFFTFILVRACGICRMRTYYVPSLSLVAFVTLVLNPLYLFSLDFQLSFGITYALAWFNEIRFQRR